MARVLARDTKGRGFDSRPFHFQVTTLGKLFTHVPLSQAVQFGTDKAAVMPCGWEGNRRSAVAHASQTSVVYPPTGSRPRQRDEHPAYALLCSTAHLPLYLS